MATPEHSGAIPRCAPAPAVAPRDVPNVGVVFSASVEGSERVGSSELHVTVAFSSFLVKEVARVGVIAALVVGSQNAPFLVAACDPLFRQLSVGHNVAGLGLRLVCAVKPLLVAADRAVIPKRIGY